MMQLKFRKNKVKTLAYQAVLVHSSDPSRRLLRIAHSADPRAQRRPHSPNPSTNSSVAGRRQSPPARIEPSFPPAPRPSENIKCWRAMQRDSWRNELKTQQKWSTSGFQGKERERIWLVENIRKSQNLLSKWDLNHFELNHTSSAECNSISAVRLIHRRRTPTSSTAANTTIGEQMYIMMVMPASRGAFSSWQAIKQMPIQTSSQYSTWKHFLF